MPQLLIPDVEPGTLARLRAQALQHGRTLESEAKTILVEALQATANDPWSAANAIRARLAATGRDFGDSTEMLREDRQR